MTAGKAAVFERLGLALLAVAVLAGVWRYMDALGDTFWYIAAGRWLLETGTFPETDPFTFTATGAPWMAWSPLSYVGFAFAEQHFGLGGLLASAALISALAHLLAWWPHSRGVVRWLLFPLVLLVIFSQREDASARGQVVADLCFTVFLWGTFHIGKTPDGELSRRQLLGVTAGLFVLGVVWMNSHQSGLVPLVLLPAYAFGLASEPSPRRRLVRVAGVLVALIYGAAVTPYGPGLIVEAIAQALSPISREIDLFRSPDFGRIDVQLILGVAVAAFLLALHDARPGRRGEAMLILALLLATLTGRRYLAWLGLTAIASLGRVELASHEERLKRQQRRIQVSACGIALGVIAYGASVDKDPLRDVPVAGVRAIDELGLPDRVYNTYHWGGYLLYAWGASERTFIDGRLYPFDDNQVYRDAISIARVAPETRFLLDTYQINTVLTERGGRLHAALHQSQDWVKRFQGRIEVVYVRRNPLPVETSRIRSASSPQ